MRVEGGGLITLPPPPLPAATVPGARAARKHGGDSPQVEVVLWRPADRETATVPSSAPRATAAAEVGSPRPSVTAGWSWTARAEQWLEQAREAGSRRNPETGEASGRKKKALDAEIFTEQ